MAAQSQRVVPDASPSMVHAIELFIENGFSIFRLWEMEGRPPADNSTYEFLVRNPDCLEQRILVELAQNLLTEIELCTHGRILASNSFWMCCAERHLADYVWERDAFPREGRLRVAELTPEDVMLSRRWQTT